MKARSLGLVAEDYINDKVVDVDLFDRSETAIEGVNPDLIDKMYIQPEGVDLDEFEFNIKFDPNQCFILTSEAQQRAGTVQPLYTNRAEGREDGEFRHPPT